ncbi:hypothetical protein PR003_g11088 [Phytophthora rubi]|uniref:Uncharacterized protein n=1 Tax=Phytophthora rubi TaxID=129364 RepID=A0A6A3JPQ6_9STRA|nr:hypothetical protein PR001_g20637 [Phytophthora rubi]KAE9028575.1 hypothetical protein PR002_g10365 [Phytophthora rubi]KAE9339292.1 hypothetical protein PR003_g11088 [Phytophthora rubi]
MFRAVLGFITMATYSSSRLGWIWCRFPSNLSSTLSCQGQPSTYQISSRGGC